MEQVAFRDGCTAAPLLLADFDFALPPELIAQQPAAPRDAARLFAVKRRTGTDCHTSVRALPDLLYAGDLLVFNDTRVVPARVVGRTRSGGAVELLLIRALEDDQRWLCLGKPARRLRATNELVFAGGMQGTVTAAPGDGRYTVRFGAPVSPWLAQHGELPLPPYIRRPDGPLPADAARYQTIFAARPGAIAAPTAGLHFTDELIAALRARGIRLAPITLHVGPGTFLPVRTPDVRQHVMEAEWCEIPEATAAMIADAKSAGGRVVAIGTTTTRALESAAGAGGRVRAGARWADCFIVPGHDFRVVDALFTNFHLPGSTLMLLVSAFAGRERMLAAYAEAVRRRYRFYSYGDAMLIE